jgi:hypothetical protein
MYKIVSNILLRMLIQYLESNNDIYKVLSPVPMAARSKARTVFGRSNIGIIGSNPAQGMDVCPRFFCVVLSCVGRGLASVWSPV